MNRLVLRYCTVRRFATQKQIPKSTSLVASSESLPNLLSDLQEPDKQTALSWHRELLESAHSNLSLNFAETVNGRTPLIVAEISNANQGGWAISAASALTTLAVYQTLVGSYSYYCILGTLGLGAALYGKFVHKNIAGFNGQKIRLVNSLQDGNIEIFTNKTKQTPIIVSKKDFIYNGTSIRVGHNYYAVPVGSFVNTVKLADLTKL